jgi:16S rRNA A1518/A1519 N6-dimethyltransferase RsmA/KsgA/DIM1 with predicted DNA glycosylase/AP lyase activity
MSHDISIPQVDVGVVRLVPKARSPIPFDVIEQVARVSFNGRRKLIRNNIQYEFEPNIVLASLSCYELQGALWSHERGRVPGCHCH